MTKVFLGGTINGSKWRDRVTEKLKIDFFNPVVDDWNEDSYVTELYEREHCDYCLYVLTPKMTGFYSIAEVIDDSNKRPMKTVFCILPKDENNAFSSFQIKSMKAIGRIVKQNGAKWLNSLEDTIDYLNSTNGKT